MIQIRDAQGNVVTGDSTTSVTVSIASGTGGTLGGTATVTAASGVVTFTDLTLAGTVGESYVLEFAASGLTSASCRQITVTPGTATTLAVSTQPAGSSSGSTCDAAGDSRSATRRATW